MTFTENSGLVKVWVRRIERGDATLEDVPNLFNLREVVEEVLGKKNA